jgi:hypothetical protein
MHHKPAQKYILNTNDKKPIDCPHCGLSLYYVGFAPQYDDQHSAEIFTCTYCNTWVDWLQPHSDETQASRPMNLGHDAQA